VSGVSEVQEKVSAVTYHSAAEPHSKSQISNSGTCAENKSSGREVLRATEKLTRINTETNLFAEG
jgi:hypothetical protein